MTWIFESNNIYIFSVFLVNGIFFQYCPQMSLAHAIHRIPHFLLAYRNCHLVLRTSLSNDVDEDDNPGYLQTDRNSDRTGSGILLMDEGEWLKEKKCVHDELVCSTDDTCGSFRCAVL